MSPLSAHNATFVLHLRLQPAAAPHFAAWQAKLHAAITPFAGFISLEILAPSAGIPAEWAVIQRFQDGKSLHAWRASPVYHQLLDELRPTLVHDGLPALREEEPQGTDQPGSVMEIFVTQVSSDQVDAYRAWIGKIHQAEALFPGFQRVYVQSPKQATGGSWITLLQFDTAASLDHWLASPERRQILQEAQAIVQSLESHHLISPFAGWFANFTKADASSSPTWKQTMIVLLVLFPIVMCELRFLTPWTHTLNASLATFIGNAISVCLIAWPMAPLAIYGLKWWLTPAAEQSRSITLAGTAVVIGLYLVEIVAFWHLL